MQLIHDVELRAHSSEPARAERWVWIAGKPTGTAISGRDLEAAVRCDQGLLLFVTYEVPYEEQLSIHFLDQNGRLLDSAHLAGPYASGVFSDLRLDPPATVHFRFFGGTGWDVQILDHTRFALPWLPDAWGVWRGGRWTRNFTVLRSST